MISRDSVVIMLSQIKRSFEMFPPLYPTYPYEIKVKCKTEHMPCKNQKDSFFIFCPGYPITHSLRPGCGRLHMNRYAADSRISHRTTVADKHWWGVLQTHLPMFWGQSSVEHHSCQRLLLHAHDNLFVSHMPITGDAAAVFFLPMS